MPTQRNTSTFFANEVGSNFNGVKNFHPQHHYVVSYLTLDIWNSLDKYAVSIIWASQNATDSAT